MNFVRVKESFCFKLFFFLYFFFKVWTCYLDSISVYLRVLWEERGGYWLTEGCKISEVCMSLELNTTANCMKLFITPLISIRKVLVTTEFYLGTPGAILFLSCGRYSYLMSSLKDKFKQNEPVPHSPPQSQTSFRIIMLLLSQSSWRKDSPIELCNQSISIFDLSVISEFSGIVGPNNSVIPGHSKILQYWLCSVPS